MNLPYPTADLKWALALAVWLLTGLILVALKRLVLGWLTRRYSNPNQKPILLGAVKSLKSFFF